MKHIHRASALLLACSLLSTAAFGQGASPPVRVDGAWARATVQGQKASGAFMALTAPRDMKLVGVASPAAGVAEVHEMKMDGDVMKMRAVPSLDLPAGKTVLLRPGGFHVMLMDLKAPLAKDTKVPLTLVLRDAAGAESRMELSVPVTARAPAPMDGHK